MLGFEQKNKIIGIDKIDLKIELYPRQPNDWLTTYRYQQAMLSGTKFPDICVAEREGRYILVDGAHRLEANKKNGKNQIEAEVLSGLTDKEIYIEAVRRNTEHGKQLSQYELANIIQRLQDMKITREGISEITHIPEDKISNFVSQRVTKDWEGNSVTLKRVVKHLSNVGRIRHSELVEELTGANPQLKMLQDLNSMIKNNWIDLNNPKIVEELEKLYQLLKKIIA